MARTRKKMTKEEKLAKDRLRKREKYASIKNDPDLYSLQKEKEKNRYLARREKNKICRIKDMTPRAQREQRRRWRKNTQNYLQRKVEKRKLEKILIENSPPNSDSEKHVYSEPFGSDPLMVAKAGPSTSQQNISVRLLNSNKRLRRIRYNHTKIIKKLNDRISKLEREKDVLRKRRNITEKLCDTIEKKVDEVLIEIRPEKKEAVKKQLLFSETITQNLQDSYRTITKKDKRNFIDTVIKDDKRLRKYKLLHKLPFSRRQKNITIDKKQKLINQIEYFFEEDTNSRFAAGKREFIKKKGIKKQKRYLNDNLKNLHDKFVTEQFRVSYSTFCKYRPFWVVFPTADRDTCQCKLHTNVNFLIKALKSAGIITESSGTHVIKSLCCDTKQTCLERTCELCANKVLNYHEFYNDKKILFYQWVAEKKPYTVKGGIQKIKIVTTKKRFEDFPRNIIHKLESTLNTFLKHNLNITVQYKVIKQLKENLNEKEILVHVDFSENYCLKYNKEIQSFHFGGSREQVSLHTGVLYYKGSDAINKIKSFCIISDCLKHDAGAIWAHLYPILKMAQGLVPYEIVHFLSNSPSSQYRNKNIFYLITKLRFDINPNISKITWNYQESGHGKGAPDGIGAVVKRTADNFVKYGGDVGCFEDFWALVTKNLPNVHFDMVTESDIERITFPPNIPRFKGSMQVHQVVWAADNNNTLAFRSLSCFDCQGCCYCIHNKHIGFLQSDTYGDVERDQSSNQSDQNESTCINDNQSVLSIDTSTILNNLDESDVFKNLQSLQGQIDLQLLPLLNVATSSTAPKSPKVKILSDVRLSWENDKFYTIPKENRNPKHLEVAYNNFKHQEQFEAFIQSTQSEKENKKYNYFEESDDSDDYNIF